MDISSLLSSLSQDDMEKLKEAAMQFFGDNQKSTPAEKIVPHESVSLPFDPKLLSGVAGLSHMLNENDDRCAFIGALKPLLSDKRKKKADDAVMMLKFMKIINTLQENGR